MQIRVICCPCNTCYASSCVKASSPAHGVVVHIDLAQAAHHLQLVARPGVPIIPILSRHAGLRGVSGGVRGWLRGGGVQAQQGPEPNSPQSGGCKVI